MVRVMAELDYAFVAEFAKVESGTLTAVGASYLEVRPPAFPAQHSFSVAGRIRAPEDTQAIGLVIRINPPPGNMNIVLNGTLTPGAETVKYDGKLAVLFTATASIALAAPGLCEIFIEVDGQQQRRLAFSVVAPQ